MSISKSEFLNVLRKSKLLGEQRLQQLADSSDHEAAAIANRLVQEKLLTEWQAKHLLTGRHQLDIGPYRLLERIQHDELGDRFLAIHSQLGRRVDLQVISSALSKDQSRCQAFIDRVGQTSTLDHPNLTHVYDVDKTGGRFYLVTEHIDGHLLAEAKGESLKLTTLVHWFQQAAAGLRHAHASGIVHGDLRLEDLIIDQEHGLKIQNQAVTGLRSLKSSRSLAIDDWKAAGLIFQALTAPLTSGPHSAVQTNEFLALLSDLKIVRDVREVEWICEQISALAATLAPETTGNEWETRLDQLEDLDVGSYEEPLEPDFVASTILADTSTETRVAAASGTNQKTTRIRDGYWDDPNEYQAEDLFSKIALQNPVGLLSSAFVIGLLLAGTATYLALAPSSKPTLAQISQAPPANAESNKTKTLVPTSLKKETKSPAENLASLNELDSAAFIDKMEQTAPPTNPTPAGQQPVKPPAANSKPPVANSKPPAANSNTTATNSNTPVANSKPPTANQQQPLPQTGSQQTSTPQQAPVTPPVKPAADKKPVPPQPDANAEALKKQMEQPFAQLPKQFPIPGTVDTVEVKLGEVFIADRFLLGAELVVNEGIANGKIHFETERDPANNQRWLIKQSRTPKDNKKAPVASLRRDGNALFFQWLPEAQTNRQAGYLKNCMLKLFVPEQSALIALRAPVEIEPLVLGADNLSAESNFELDFLPSPANLLVELLPVTIPETSLSPGVIDLAAGIPGRVLLVKNETNAVVWLNIGLDLKSKSTVRADMVCADGIRIRPIKDVKELQKMAATFKNQELLLTQQVKVTEATQVPQNKANEKKNVLAELNKQKNFAVNNAKKFQQYVDTAPKLIGHPFGIRIFARYDGFEVELARSKLQTSAPTPPAPK